METRLITKLHNNPPSDMEILAEKMQEIYPDHLSRAEQLLAQEAEMTFEEITDDETAGRVGDYMKQIAANAKALDTARSGEKEPYLAAGRLVDGFFKRYTEKLGTAKDKVGVALGVYTERKKAEDARRREEKAQREREEAEAKFRESERLRKEAEEARREQERQAEEARKAAEAERQRIARETEEARKKQQEEIDRLKREKEEADAAARAEIQKMKDDADRKDKAAAEEIAAAERKRKEEAEAHKESLRLAQEEAKRIEQDRREQEKAARDAEREQEQALKDASRATKATEREANALLDEADRHDKAAQKMDRAALNVTGHTRGEEGSLTTTTTRWVGQMQDRDLIDLEVLRHHFRAEDIDHAVQQAVNSGARQIRGALICEDVRVQVR